MKARAFLAVLLAAAVPAWTLAQEMPEPSPGGDLAQIMTFQVAPSDVYAFQTTMAKLVSAASEANLAANYGWHMWTDQLGSFTLVYPVPNMAYFDDEEQWMRQFEGTPGEATLTAAFEAFEPLDAQVTSSEIAEAVPNWTYEPTTAHEWNHAEVHEFWLKPGQQNVLKFDALSQEFIGFFKNLEFPYTVIGHRVRMGESRTFFVVAYDNKPAFYGQNTVENLAQQKGMQEQWGELLGRLTQLIVRAHTTSSDFLPDMTYMPTMETTSQQ